MRPNETQVSVEQTTQGERLKDRPPKPLSATIFISLQFLTIYLTLVSVNLSVVDLVTDLHLVRLV